MSGRHFERYLPPQPCIRCKKEIDLRDLNKKGQCNKCGMLERIDDLETSMKEMKGQIEYLMRK